jgi:hypothetical protein
MLTTLPALVVLLVGKLMIKLSLWPNIMKTVKLGVEESDAAHRIDPSVFDFISMQPPR